jgi:hypothetical protein
LIDWYFIEALPNIVEAGTISNQGLLWSERLSAADKQAQIALDWILQSKSVSSASRD